MSISDYLDTFSGQNYHPDNNNCWHLASGWLRECGQDDFVRMVDDRYKKARETGTVEKARHETLNPIWAAQHLIHTLQPAPGNLAMAGRRDVWVLGLVGDDCKPVFWSKKGLTKKGVGAKVYFTWAT